MTSASAKTKKGGKAHDLNGAAAIAAAPVSVPQKSPSLYDISREYSELEDLLSGIEGDISPDDQKKLASFLAGLDKDRNAKIDAYCGLIRDLEARQEARDKEAKRFAKLAKYDENKVARLKWVLLTFLQTHKFPTIETDKFRVRRSANAAAPIVVDKQYEDKPELLKAVDARFVKVKHELNKTEIKTALDAGEVLDFARYGEKGENLRIE